MAKPKGKYIKPTGLAYQSCRYIRNYLASTNLTAEIMLISEDQDKTQSNRKQVTSVHQKYLQGVFSQAIV